MLNLSAEKILDLTEDLSTTDALIKKQLDYLAAAVIPLVEFRTFKNHGLKMEVTTRLNGGPAVGAHDWEACRGHAAKEMSAFLDIVLEYAAGKLTLQQWESKHYER